MNVLKSISILVALTLMFVFAKAEAKALGLLADDTRESGYGP